jgi:hypothetical protein
MCSLLGSCPRTRALIPGTQGLFPSALSPNLLLVSSKDVQKNVLGTGHGDSFCKPKTWHGTANKCIIWKIMDGNAHHRLSHQLAVSWSVHLRRRHHHRRHPCPCFESASSHRTAPRAQRSLLSASSWLQAAARLRSMGSASKKNDGNPGCW